MTDRMKGKVALVTGAARGQGRSHAVRLAQEGADIIALDICAPVPGVNYAMPDPDDLAETARQIGAFDRRVVTIVADVRDREVLSTAVASAVAELGHLDVVVANAGISPIGPQTPFTAYFETVEINLGGVVNTIHAAYEHLSAGGSIVCTGSMAALLPGNSMASPKAGAGAAGYSYAKRAVARLVHDLAIMLAPQSIRINAVHPGNIDTPMLQNQEMYRLFRPDLENPGADDAQAAFGSMHLLPVNTLDPNDISEAVLFLASDSARYITGSQLAVDAGATLPTRDSGAPA
ncbi:mycofactocin-coupled SDR family oxidoreductase [Kineosporia babensis]|uniref:Mycofactocin-coupled SDR family oxidoreductase n=1 Tax=Kineosporia babensis TaxID=499548 RepID=A0A9X1NFJ6_9ACTN|nr:mycofactocin-coupled SDR family oxidoreductase [Kineosporia babensis]MCD5314062.1 mycofactocin-coupled SDR family oxidoreductase [Kineosporia babensis]